MDGDDKGLNVLAIGLIGIIVMPASVNIGSLPIGMRFRYTQQVLTFRKWHDVHLVCGLHMA